jgi:hypothetical protein
VCALSGLGCSLTFLILFFPLPLLSCLRSSTIRPSTQPSFFADTAHPSATVDRLLEFDIALTSVLSIQGSPDTHDFAQAGLHARPCISRQISSFILSC